MALLTPYVINGAKHPARLFRRQLQLASSGAAGVGRPDDFKVLPLNVPGAGVRVSAGGALIPSRDAGASRETYGVENDAEITFLGEDGEGIPGTGSSGGRRDMVIVEVMDPEMSAVTYPVPTDPDFGAYSRIRVVPGVPSDATRVEDVPALANVTAYGLAIIDWPASTGTITEAMITDIREVANPRRSEVVFARPRIAADDNGQQFLTSSYDTGGEFFPGGAGSPNNFQIDVPAWATHMIIDARWMAVYYKNNPFGRYWVEYGDEYRAHTWPNNQQYEFATQHFNFNAPNTGSDEKSAEWSLMDTRTVPAKLRGKRISLVFKAGRRDSGGNQDVWMNALGGLGMRITFAEGLTDANII